MEDRHLDLVRNDWDEEQQVLIARIEIGDASGIGVIVKPEANGRDWDKTVRDAIGPTALEPTERIVARLTGYFDGTYLFVSEPHTWGTCPYRGGSPLEMKRKPVNGEYELPEMGGDVKTSL